MSGSVHADGDGLRAAAEQCRETSDDLGGGLARLLEQVETLTGRGLSGASGLALHSVFGNLTEHLGEMTRALNETADLLEGSAAGYAVHDEEIARDLRAADASDVFRALRGPDGAA